MMQNPEKPLDKKIVIENVSLKYSDGTESLKNVSLDIIANSINVILGPSGGGKSSILRLINRLNDLASVEEQTGHIYLNGMDVNDPHVDVIQLRRTIGMVFSRPISLPMSIRKNIIYGLELMGERRQKVFDEVIERTLRQAYLWDEVKDRLDSSGNALSGGQKQRLCLARTLALHPEVILLDEPTSGLDPVSTNKVEESLQELKNEYTIVLVPHSVQQGARTADFASFFLQGELVEWGRGKDLFLNPQDIRTEDYVEGRFG